MSGTTPWDFITGSGYQYEYAGENLAKNFMFSQGVVDAWMNSPSHKENLMRKDYTDVGFAVVNGVLNGEETTLVVQLFGKPLGTQLAKEEKPEMEKTVNPLPDQKPAKIPAVNKQQSPVILSKISPARENFLFNLSLGTNAVFIVFLFIAVLLDFYFASRLKLIRIGSKNLAHMIFIGFILIGFLLFTKGTIL